VLLAAATTQELKLTLLVSSQAGSRSMSAEPVPSTGLEHVAAGPSATTGHQGQPYGSGVQQQLSTQQAEAILCKYDGGTAPNMPLRWQEHAQDLSLLIQVADQPICLQHCKGSLLLYSSQQDPMTQPPACRPGQLLWPLEQSPGSDAVMRQVAVLGHVQLLHLMYATLGSVQPFLQQLVPPEQHLTVHQVGAAHAAARPRLLQTKRQHHQAQPESCHSSAAKLQAYSRCN
jgi:hypothetical protein